MSNANDRPIEIAGRRLVPTPVFDSYWRFAVERQRVYERRLSGSPAPWTDDAVIAENRFTNVFRAADRVSQHLIRHVIYDGPHDETSLVLRILLYKFFNKIETWHHIVNELGQPSADRFDYDTYDDTLGRLFERTGPMYSAAYVVPPPRFGEPRKYQNHLRLIEHILEPSIAAEILQSTSMENLYKVLRSIPSLGNFLAFQLAIDMNYSELFKFSELDFVVAGPGAVDGIRKCFGVDAVGIEAEVIRWVVENQIECCSERGLKPPRLWGRSLQLIDAQNLFCEVDKYARVMHPDVRTPRGRSRIKQKYRQTGQSIDPPFFPPFWGINDSARTTIDLRPLDEYVPTGQLALL